METFFPSSFWHVGSVYSWWIRLINCEYGAIGAYAPLAPKNKWYKIVMSDDKSWLSCVLLSRVSFRYVRSHMLYFGDITWSTITQYALSQTTYIYFYHCYIIIKNCANALRAFSLYVRLHVTSYYVLPLDELVYHLDEFSSRASSGGEPLSEPYA